MALALERGRLTAVEHVKQQLAAGGSLLRQLGGIDVAYEVRRDGTITVTRPEGTYVFQNVTRHQSGKVSARVSVFDVNDILVDTIVFNRGLEVVNDNQINYRSVVVSPDGRIRTENGSIVGLRDQAGEAIAFVDHGDGETAPVAVHFGSTGVDSTDGSHDRLITITGMDTSDTQGSVATHDSCEKPPGEDGMVATVAGCAVVIVVVVLFVVVTCLIFGWWGC